MAWVFDQAPTSSPTDHLVLLAIADRCNDDGQEAWPSLPTLARKTRLSERAVWGAIRRLQKLGLLVITPGRGRRRSNRYQVVIQPAASRTTCDLAPRATSHLVHGSSRTTCDLDLAPRASDPSIDPSTEPSSNRTAAAPRFARLAKEPNGDNYRVVEALAIEVLKDLGLQDEGELIEAVKCACALRFIDYGRHPDVDSDVVHRACASALFKHRNPDITRRAGIA